MSAVAGPTILFEIFHNDRIIRDSPSGANWADQYHLIECDGSGDGVIVTLLKTILMGFATIQDDTGGTLQPAVHVAGATYDSSTGYTSIPFKGDANKTYAVRIIGKHGGR